MFINAERKNILTQDSLEHLVLQSGDRALENMVHVFRRQLHEDNLQLLSGCGKKLVKTDEYRTYEQDVRTLMAPHWQGPARGLKKHVRRSLKPFRKSSGLLSRLLSTPARITATACMTVLLAGSYNADASVLPGSADNLQLISPSAVKQETQRREVVFADASLKDLETLLSSAPVGASVKLLQPNGNLIGQMLDHLLQTGPADSLHVFTHGAPGQLQLGKAVIDQTTLKQQTRQLNILGSLLTGSRDIFVYGCQVAAGSEGNDFIHKLSVLTGADVAASDDFTGSVAQGGDWELELVAGNVNDRVISSQDYSALLAPANPGHIMAGDGSGGGGGGGYSDYSYGDSSYSGDGGAGGAGGGNNDTMTGTAGDDVLFGDGSGGGGGGTLLGTYFGYTPGAGGDGGGGNDAISGGAGNDILFGDGFDGLGGLTTGGAQGVGGDGGAGGFGGGGGGGGGGANYIDAAYGGNGGIGGGGGGGGDYSPGGNGGYAAGGGGSGGYSDGGYGGGFNATDGGSLNDDAGGGGGGGGFAGGIGGPGGIYSSTPAGPGGTGGSDASTTTGGGNGGGGGSDYGAGGGGGGFGGGNGGLGGDDDDLAAGTGIGEPGTAGGTAPITLIDDPTQTVYFHTRSMLGTLSTFDAGAGDDILDGGPGSDELFGMGGTNTFVFESDDATSGFDTDTIHDWRNGTANQIALGTGGVSLDSSQVDAIIAAQTTAPTGKDRTIVHKVGTNQVTIVVLDISQDLVASDFVFDFDFDFGKQFPWTMFMPALVTPKK